MRKSNFFFMFFLVFGLCCFPCTVLALVPGESDYKPMQSAVLSDIKGDSFELVSTDSQAILSLDKSVLPKDVFAVSFNARSVYKGDTAYLMATKALKGISSSKIELFDFSLMDLEKNQNITTLNGKLSITIACGSGVNSVFYFNEKTSEIEDMHGVLSKNSRYITFETNHFSYFMLAKIDETNSTVSTVQKEDSNAVKIDDKAESSIENTPESKAEAADSTKKDDAYSDKQESETEKTAVRQSRDMSYFVCAAVLILSCEFLFTIKRVLCK